MRPLLLAVATAVAGICVALAAGANAAADGPDADAAGLVARLSIPGVGDEAGPSAAAPPDGAGGGAVALPVDGTALRIGTSSLAVRALPGTSSSAEATVSALGISILGGEITAEALSLRAVAAAGSSGAAADTSSSSLTGLVVLGQPVTVTDTTQLAVGDWGTLQALQWTTEIDDQSEPHSGRAAISGIRVELTLDHAGFPAGTVIEVGSVSASAVAAPPPPVTATATTETTETTETTPDDPLAPLPPPDIGVDLGSSPITPADRADREPGESIAGAPPALVRPAPEVVARLSTGGYVFPVFGPASFGDSFGAYRGDVPGKWHHGEDIVAPAGAPLLAVANGTIFSVGWNAIGGWRLWLRDDAGNEFYYAHLSAYSPLAVEGQRVRAGDVIGFVGSTGDAEGGVPHLHFEIHPVSMLSLGYDGVVAPYPFLVAWRRAEDVSFDAGRRYVPDDELRPGVGLPRVGAYLLEINDIGRTSGLVPGALEKALGERGG